MQKIKKNKLINKWVLVFLSIILFLGTVTIGFISVGRSSILNADSFGVDNITFTESGSDGTWTISERKIIGAVTGEDGGTCSSDKDKSSTLTINYIGNVDAKISFNYKLTANDGSGQIDGENITGSGDFSKDIIVDTSNKSINLYIKSNNSNETTLIISNFQVITDTPINLTLIPQENGSFTYNGEVVNVEKKYEINAKDSFTLEAKPYDNYDFVGWYFNNQIFSQNNPLTTTYDVNATIYPFFVLSDRALFSYNNTIYVDLQKAADDAKNDTGNPTIKLIKSGTIQNNRTYNIHENTILFIPKDADSSPIYDESIINNINYGTIKPYLTLSLLSNTTINFNNNSTLYLGGMYLTGQPSSGIITGGYGHINLNDTTSILNLNDSSKLYCYGYITGKGVVNANSGTNVYEIFQISSWRGGTWSTLNYSNSKKVFIINQYYIQNIEARLRIYKGANITVSAAVTISKLIGDDVETHRTSAIFLGDSGVFRLQEGYIERVYDYTNDRIVYTVSGKAMVSSITLKVSIINLDSSKCVLPINNNFTINVLSGSEITIDQDVCLLPGAVLNVENGSHLRFSNDTSLYVYDNDNWYNNSYAYSSKDIVLNTYSATLERAPTRTLTKDSPDAEINLNGEMTLNNGAAIYTTIVKDSSGNYVSGGANIHSTEGTGKVTFVQGLGTETETYQVADGAGDFESIPIDPAYLKNGPTATEEYFIPGSVEGGVTNKTIVFDKTTDSWNLEEFIGRTYILKFINSETGEIKESTYTVNQEFSLPTSEELDFYYNNYSIKKWEIPTIGVFDVGESISLGDLGDLKIYAIFGGWFNDNSNSYYIDYETGEYYKGLKRVLSESGDKTIIALFDENSGLFLDTYNGIYLDNRTNSVYYLEFGIVNQDEGFKYIAIDLSTFKYEYIYVSTDNSLLTNGTYYIETNDNDILPSGYYTFDENGCIVKEDSDTSHYNQEVYIANINEQGDATYIDGIRVSYGLLINNGHYYYSDSNGFIVKNKTYYVNKTNGLGINEGLYYFDELGRMYDESFNLIEVN